MTSIWRYVGLLAIGTLALGCVEGLEIDEATFDVTVCADGETIDGIDVSKWQGTINWSQVAGDGVEFAIIRVSDGLNYPDGQFVANWAGARDNGILRGAYQFFRPGQDPIAQAELLLDAMGSLEADDLPPVIDVEAADGLSQSVVASKIQQWVDHVEAATGRVPIIYTGKYFWQDYVASDAFVDYPLWIAQYGPTCPDLPAPWTEWSFFQTSSSGRVAGISGNVDTNLFNGSIADLLDFAGVAVECGDALCNGSEDYDSCPADCPPCQLLAAEGGIVDDGGPCFVAGGNPDYIRSETAGYADSLKWTHATDYDAPENYGEWKLIFAEAGEYLVEAYVVSEFAHSQQARYEVEHDGGSDNVIVDQSGTDGWIEIGAFEFAAGAGQSIRVDDNTGEPLSGDVRLTFDAIRLTRIDDDPDDPIRGDPDYPDDPYDPADPADPGADGELSGGCSTSHGSKSSLWLLILVGLAIARRRWGR